MSSILDRLQSGAIRQFETGEIVVEQGKKTGMLLFLVEGSVEVVKDGVQVVVCSQPGAVFGELSALLDCQHTATVRALQPCRFQVVEHPREFLEGSPQICLHVCELVARRLDALNNYLVDVKQQFAGEDHIGMVDGVLETLMHRQPSKRIRAGDSAVGQGELPH